jgi:hypothetical protein
MKPMAAAPTFTSARRLIGIVASRYSPGWLGDKTNAAIYIIADSAPQLQWLTEDL